MTTRRDIIKAGAGIAAILASGRAPAYLVKSILGAAKSGILASESSIPTAADYVQDGIFSMWDAIENNGWGSHIDYTDKWLDLVDGFYLQSGGGDAGDFSNGYLDRKIALWNGVGDPETQQGMRYYSKAISLRKMLNGGRFTVELSHCPHVSDLTSWGFNNIALGPLGLRSSHHSLSYLANGKIKVYNTLFEGETPKEIQAPQMYNQVKETRTVIFDAEEGSVSVFIDGDLCNNTQLKPTISWNNGNDSPLMFTNTCIGVVVNNPANTWGETGESISDLFSFRIYSRPLNIEEVYYNHQIDKARFGIP